MKKNRERLQAYEGVVIAKRNRGSETSFTVRKISSGEGVGSVHSDHFAAGRCHRSEAPWRDASRQALLTSAIVPGKSARIKGKAYPQAVGVVLLGKRRRGAAQ